MRACVGGGSEQHKPALTPGYALHTFLYLGAQMLKDYLVQAEQLGRKFLERRVKSFLMKLVKAGGCRKPRSRLLKGS